MEACCLVDVARCDDNLTVRASTVVIDGLCDKLYYWGPADLDR